KKMNQVGLLEEDRFAERSTGKFTARAIISFTEETGSGGREFRDSRVFPMGFIGRDSAVDACHMTVGGGDLLGVVRRMLGAMCIAPQPVGIHTQGDVGRMMQGAGNDVA